MARMIPPMVQRDYPAQGELEIFRRLRDDPGTRDWIALHSLALATHERRVAGEIDFVVIIPGKGVLSLEVKGCSAAHLRRVDGIWYYGPEDEGDRRGPFRQASEAMHSLRRQLVGRRPELRRVLFASGVVFPYAPFTESSIEWNAWEVIDSQALRAASISGLLTRLMDAAREHLTKAATAPALDPRGPTPEQCAVIAAELRSNFELPIDPVARAAAVESELRRYTAEQFEALDAMGENPRILFAGPAGTGKTFLAVEAARRARAEGGRVLFVCFNRLLGGWLAEQTADLRPEVVTETLHRRLLTMAGLARAPEGADHAFWEDRLPELACDRLTAARGENDQASVFDELVVDEAQDLLRHTYLDFLDLSLRGGLAAGRWRMFGDFENQAIYASGSIPLKAFRANRAGGVPLYLLRANCRNTPLVAEWVHLLAGLNPPYSRVLRPDDGVRPRLRFYGDDAQQRDLLITALSELREAGYRWEEMVVLSTRSERLCAAARVNTEPWGARLRPLSGARAPGIRYGSVHSFKGLESTVTVVTDVDTVSTEIAKSLLYVAITRATQRLVILAHERVREEALGILSKASEIARNQER